MKKTMKRMLAALLAAACLPLTGVTANADVDWYWGTATNDAFDDLVPVNTYGWNGYSWGTDKKNVNFLRDPDSDRPWVISALPRENAIRFTLRSAEDTDAMLDVMEQYFPDIRASYDAQLSENIGVPRYNPGRAYGEWSLYAPDFGILADDIGRVYELTVNDDTVNKAELETGLLRELAKAHLIESFYGWGATAFYEAGEFYYDVLTGYLDTNSFYTGRENGKDVFTKYTIDWDAVQAYLDEHHPGCQVERYEYHAEREESRLYDEGTSLTRIVTPDTMTYKDKFELACELYEPFHMPVDVLFLEEASSDPLLGHNSLENKGDVTLDLELDIMDVIAANKGLLGSEALCDTARKNADISGDGTPDTTDSLAIMKEIVGITEDFQET